MLASQRASVPVYEYVPVNVTTCPVHSCSSLTPGFSVRDGYSETEMTVHDTFLPFDTVTEGRENAFRRLFRNAPHVMPENRYPYPGPVRRTTRGNHAMRGSAKLHHRPYIPLNRPDEAKNPWIVRLSPGADRFCGEWLDAHDTGPHTLCIMPRGTRDVAEMPLDGPEFTVTGLEPGTEYELFVRGASGRESRHRLVRTGAVPAGATVINYLHPEDPQYLFSGKYLCSPSLARLDNGRLVAGMDVFGGKMGQVLTILFYSDNDGADWHYLTDLYPFYWGSLFVHRGVLYILGLTTEYGNLQIACSRDNGETWSAPSVLFYGANVLSDNGGMHRAPMHVVSRGGRLYTTCEYGSWGSGQHLPAVISVRENDDLMVAENWCCTGFLSGFAKAGDGQAAPANTMEGSLVTAPDGRFYNILRWKHKKALILEADPEDPEASLRYICERDMPVTTSMFRILPYRDGYLLITNRETDDAACKDGPFRNVLSLYTSRDLLRWDFLRDVVNFGREDQMKFGFQYPAPLLEGGTLYLNVRSAYNHADRFHDSNTMLFWKIPLSPEQPATERMCNL